MSCAQEEELIYAKWDIVRGRPSLSNFSTSCDRYTLRKKTSQCKSELAVDRDLENFY